MPLGAQYLPLVLKEHNTCTYHMCTISFNIKYARKIFSTYMKYNIFINMFHHTYVPLSVLLL